MEKDEESIRACESVTRYGEAVRIYHEMYNWITKVQGDSV